MIIAGVGSFFFWVMYRASLAASTSWRPELPGFVAPRCTMTDPSGFIISAALPVCGSGGFLDPSVNITVPCIALLVMLMRGRSLVRRRSDFVRKTAIPSPNVCVFSCSMCSCIKLLSVFGGGIGKFAGGFGCMSFVFVTLGCSVSVLKLFGGLSTPLVAFDSGIVAD